MISEIAQTTLVIQGPNRHTTHSVAPGIVTLGRAEDNTIVLSSLEVSRYHAKLEAESYGWSITDLGSHNGTYLNGTRLAQQETEVFGATDQVQIGPFTLSWEPASLNSVPAPISSANISAEPAPITPVTTPTKRRVERQGQIDLNKQPKVALGRVPDNDLVIDHPQASRHHAVIEKVGQTVTVTDLGSTNGTFVNGQRISAATTVKEGDTIQIASYRFVLRGNVLEHFDDHGNIEVDALHLEKIVGKAIKILNDVSLSIQPREFVALVGGSGAGKTTLLDALNGFRPATSGQVLYNGANLYQNFDAYRNVIGYVPQDDIIHRELTVYGALNYAAQLRLPRDTSAQERNERIDTVLNDLGLAHRRDTPISRLSGGQRKRVSIGVELLNKPSLIFLDEPTSGLDPSTETKMMRLLRELADQGHTVLLVTHVTGNVSLCDKVAIMAPGGLLAFYGPPKEALPYFQVRDFVDIYDILENGKAEELHKKFLESPQYQAYVAEPLAQEQERAAEPTNAASVKPGFKHISALQQFMILSRRNLEILVRDRASLVLMLLVAPLLGLVNFVTWKSNLFDVQAGNAQQGMSMLFIAALNCVLVGSLASMREIVKETEVYRRERMVGLGIVPYLGSKVWLGGILALYQAFMFVLFNALAVPSLPHDPTALAQMYITLTLTVLAGMLMGLFVSAVSPNQNVAPLLVILLIVPQIIFGGGILPTKTLPNGNIISMGTITKWSFDSLVTIAGVGKDVADDSCWQISSARADPNFHATTGQDDNEVLHRWQDTLSEPYKKSNCRCLGPNIFTACKFPGITANYTAADEAAVNSPEPPKPYKPGDPPAQPNSPPAAPTSPGEQPQCSQSDPACLQQLKAWQDKFTAWQTSMTDWSTQMNNWKTQMDSWKTEMDAYKTSTNQYQDGMNSWQTRYSDWATTRNKAIGNVEAVIRANFENYGQYYEINLVQGWGALVGIVAVFFALIFVAQKLKDRAAR